MPRDVEHHKDARDVLALGMAHSRESDTPTRTEACVAELCLAALSARDLVVRPADEAPPGYVREEDVIVWASADGRLHCSTLVRERNAAIEERDRERGMAHEADVHRERMRAKLAEARHEREEWAQRAGEAVARAEAAERERDALREALEGVDRQNETMGIVTPAFVRDALAAFPPTAPAAGGEG